MTRLLALVPLALAWGCAPPLPDAPGPEEVEALAAEVREVTRALGDAVREHDAERILSFYEPSEDFVYAGVDEVREGFEPFRRTVEMWHRRHPDVETTADLVKVRVLSRDVAVAVLRGHSDDAGPMAWSRTLVRQPDGRWLIVLEHEAWRAEPAPARYHGSGAMPGAAEAPAGAPGP